MHKVFISYHHANDQWAKNQLQQWADQYGLFIDVSVDTNDINDNLPTESTRRIIRDDYLRDSSVTVVLVGTETRGRKHVDWEIYSSMYDGAVNKQSGVLVVQLPSTNPAYWTAAHEVEKAAVYPDCTSWSTISDRAGYERRYPYLPTRIIDNLLAPKAKVSVTTWDRIAGNLNNLVTMIDATYDDRTLCEYDLSRQMRSNNAPALILSAGFEVPVSDMVLPRSAPQNIIVR
ncbi:TIR domain-containing protein [Ensifer sp. ENS11]|uniref:TIR domain-containing protein n=1 Tax=Ensifer sp. ENS11 TaxID=2769291 RepID=UPI00178609B5|nr:TIR domain-containing protein [Ensifer sp. ENS11]MBD9489933.1 TIR domain-containing protein [Ensifer sp. ENS11]